MCDTSIRQGCVSYLSGDRVSRVGCTSIEIKENLVPR